jgi:putative membrane-bound dehydrogenase-like protein
MYTRWLALVHAILLVTALLFGGVIDGEEHESTELKGPVGPATEKRFPALQVPDGFKATLFACDPLIEYASVIALGPRQATLFVAHDYVTGLGVEIIRRDEIRLIEDTDGDGYADKSTVYAKGFNSIQGLAFDDGDVFAMHAPFLTRLRDTDGDGIADQRRDLFLGLGLPPEENSNRLHCANGVVAGHDGWLYLALGDRGCDVLRPEGDRLVFRKGGILRCRRDGSDLHVFATGLRNIYDVALDEQLNVFVRDNENDGGDYMIRVCHCFFGSDHGYPYHYYERPNEALRPLADLGRGSSAGGVCYLETSFPPAFHGSLFFCEWGRAVVRYDKDPKASSFAEMVEVDFAVGDPTDPYGFKPTDLVVDRDGSLLVSDWADGQRPKRGRGRIYRITSTDGESTKPVIRTANKTVDDWISTLSSPSYHVRLESQQAIERHGDVGRKSLMQAIRNGKVEVAGRLHAVWVLAHSRDSATIDELFRIANFDSDPRVQAQAIRAIADLFDPILAKHRIDADTGDPQIAKRLAGLAVESDSRVLLEVIIALGRLRWSGSADWLRREITEDADQAIMHAAMQTIRKSANWPDTFAIIDDSQAAVRPAARRAIAEQYETGIVDPLLDRLDNKNPHRREYADLLSRVYNKLEPWQYWGFRPAPRPPNTVMWKRTEQIKVGLVGLLADEDHAVRLYVLRRMLREQIPIPSSSLANWLEDENGAEPVSVILAALRGQPSTESRSLLESIVRSDSHTDDNRSAALNMLVESLGRSEFDRLLDLARVIKDGPILAKILSHIGNHKQLRAATFLLAKLDSNDGEVRASAILALATTRSSAAAPRIALLLLDADVRVRRAAASAAGPLNASPAVDSLLAMASDSDSATRRGCFQSLMDLNAGGAVDMAVASLENPEIQLTALAYIKQFGNSRQQPALTELAQRNRSHDIQISVIHALSQWAGSESETSKRNDLLKDIARIQGDAGAMLRWEVLGPTSPDKIVPTDSSKRTLYFVDGVDGQVRLPAENATTDSVWIAAAVVFLKSAKDVEWFASSSGTLQIKINREVVFQSDKVTPYRLDQHRFATTLPAGESQLSVRVAGIKDRPRFQLRFRHKSSKVEHEKLTSQLLSSRGNLDRGREVFRNADKSQCVRCHRIGADGPRIGPDLAGIGSRFSRIHLIESILQPSRTIAPSYSTHSIVLTDGRVLSGVKIAEDQDSITLGDAQGKVHQIAKEMIDQSVAQKISTMPEGLEKKLTERELIDLLAFLLSNKK